MSVRSLNLLRYPRRLQLTVSPRSLWVLGGGLAGLLAGLAWGLWSLARLDAWQHEVQRLQARQAQQARVQALASERSKLAFQEQQAMRKLQDWQSQRDQLLRLHALLTQSARDSGLQLRLWQGDERRLQLQGWLPHMQDLPQLQAQLSAAGPSAWSLHSLSAGAGPGVELVLQASWPLVAPAAAASSPQTPATFSSAGQP